MSMAKSMSMPAAANLLAGSNMGLCKWTGLIVLSWIATCWGWDLGLSPKPLQGNESAIANEDLMMCWDYESKIRVHCPGLKIAWLQEPPQELKQGDGFQVEIAVYAAKASQIHVHFCQLEAGGCRPSDQTMYGLTQRLDVRNSTMELVPGSLLGAGRYQMLASALVGRVWVARQISRTIVYDQLIPCVQKAVCYDLTTNQPVGSPLVVEDCTRDPWLNGARSPVGKLKEFENQTCIVQRTEETPMELTFDLPPWDFGICAFAGEDSGHVLIERIALEADTDKTLNFARNRDERLYDTPPKWGTRVTVLAERGQEVIALLPTKRTSLALLSGGIFVSWKILEHEGLMRGENSIMGRPLLLTNGDHSSECVVRYGSHASGEYGLETLMGSPGMDRGREDLQVVAAVCYGNDFVLRFRLLPSGWTAVMLATNAKTGFSNRFSHEEQSISSKWTIEDTGFDLYIDRSAGISSYVHEHLVLEQAVGKRILDDRGSPRCAIGIAHNGHSRNLVNHRRPTQLRAYCNSSIADFAFSSALPPRTDEFTEIKVQTRIGSSYTARDLGKVCVHDYGDPSMPGTIFTNGGTVDGCFDFLTERKANNTASINLHIRMLLGRSLVLHDWGSNKPVCIIHTKLETTSNNLDLDGMDRSSPGFWQAILQRRPGLVMFLIVACAALLVLLTICQSRSSGGSKKHKVESVDSASESEDLREEEQESTQLITTK